MIETEEGTQALALELCREFEDKLLLHLQSGEASGWKVLSSFEGTLPNRFKQLLLDGLFDPANVKKCLRLMGTNLTFFLLRKFLDSLSVEHWSWQKSLQKFVTMRCTICLLTSWQMPQVQLLDLDSILL